MMNGNGQGRATGKEPVERVVDLFVHLPIGFAVMAWKRLPELVVSVPELVGQVVAKGCTQLAEAEERLSEEVRKARMIGQVALTFGGRQVRREVDARLSDARRKAEGVAGFIPGLGGDGGSNGAGARPGGASVSAAATTATAPSAPASGPAPPKPTGARRATKAPSARTTPAKAAPRTGSAAKATKATKAAKESAAKATSSAAGPRRAASRTPGAASAAELPIREYDGLSASQVVSRLTGLTPDELRSVRAYEEGSRGRRTVLLAIDRLLG